MNISTVESGCSQKAQESPGSDVTGYPSPFNTSKLGGFSHDEVEGAVNAVFRPSPVSPSPRRVGMGEMARVDDTTIGILQGSSRWKSSLSHIERVVQAEHVAPAGKADFVARTFKQRPGVVYAVRYG